MRGLNQKIVCRGLIIALVLELVEAGVIKDIFQKITNTNNKTDGLITESSPICGNELFSTPNQYNLSPELIFITNSPTSNFQPNQPNNQQGSSYSNYDRNQNRRRESSRNIEEVANEFRFNADNVTLEELERQGFNRDAPITFLIHGFTSGYPLQSWMTAIVEAYTIDRESSSHDEGYVSVSEQADGYNDHHGHNHNDNQNYNTNFGQSGSNNFYNPNYGRNQSNHNSHSNVGNYPGYKRRRSNYVTPVRHNLFIVNWNYAARGILYPRAVANIPIVATYVTRFINDKLIRDAQIDSRRIQLIGHSLGAHLAGFVGKNTRSKLERIYGLDPAGPCFGAISGPLYPSSKRLAASDAEQVISIHTDTDLLGIDKALGRYAVFVEGGNKQPGCRSQGGILKSLSTLTWDGGDLDTVSCSHSRAPNLLTYRHRQSDCQMVAYGCDDWKSFEAGHCGVCSESVGRRDRRQGPLQPVECIRIGLDWQYPKRQRHTNQQSANYNRPSYQNERPDREPYRDTTNQSQGYMSGRNSTRRPTSHSGISDNQYNGGTQTQNYDQPFSSASQSSSQSGQRPLKHREYNQEPRYKRDDDGRDEKRSYEKIEPITMFMKTSDTQPYCAYHYQVVLELNEPFPSRKPSVSLVFHDSEPNQGQENRQREQNSVVDDHFGFRYDDRTYTHLITSNKKLKRVDHATLLFRDKLPNGNRILKSLSINYMSNIDPRIREKFSSRLCPTIKNNQDDSRGLHKDTRFFFEPCARN